jgi:hypothetical protein
MQAKQLSKNNGRARRSSSKQGERELSKKLKQNKKLLLLALFLRTCPVFDSSCRVAHSLRVTLRMDLPLEGHHGEGACVALATQSLSYVQFIWPFLLGLS